MNNNRNARRRKAAGTVATPRWAKDDFKFFAANPDRRYRVRRQYAHEFPPSVPSASGGRHTRVVVRLVGPRHLWTERVGLPANHDPATYDDEDVARALWEVAAYARRRHGHCLTDSRILTGLMMAPAGAEGVQ